MKSNSHRIKTDFSNRHEEQNDSQAKSKTSAGQDDGNMEFFISSHNILNVKSKSYGQINEKTLDYLVMIIFLFTFAA